MNRITNVLLTALFVNLSLGVVEGQPSRPVRTPVNVTISQTPWFSDQTVQGHLKINADQVVRLNKAYADAWLRYQKGLSELRTDVSPMEHARRIRELQIGFDKQFFGNINEVMTDSDLRQRFHQLYLQQRSYDAFSDPMVQQKLNLTTEQCAKLEVQHQEWVKNMNDLGTDFQKDHEGATTRFHNLLNQERKRIDAVLTPDQQKTWNQLVGDVYMFPPGAYFPPTVVIKQSN